MENKEADIIVPDMHFARISDEHGDSGEFKLMLEVFRDGIVSALSWKRQESRWKKLTEDEKEIVLEALAWLIEDGIHISYCGFVPLCELLGFDPDYIRDRILGILDLEIFDILYILRRNNWKV